MADLRALKRMLWQFAFWASLACLLVAIVFPFYWMVKTSMDTGTGIFSYPPRFLPTSYALEGYATVVKSTPVWLWLWNSFVVATASTVLALVAGVTGAYGLSRFRYRGKGTLALVILTTQMMPPLVLIIPIYTIFIGLRLTDTLFGLVLGNFAFSLPVVIWMMKSIFDSIPVEIEEAARVDGASWPYILWRVTLPIALPGLVATGIFTFLNGWDEFMFARTIVSSADKWVGTVGLASFIGVYVTAWDQILAAATIFTVPPVVLFLLVQKYFIAGLGAGAVRLTAMKITGTTRVIAVIADPIDKIMSPQAHNPIFDAEGLDVVMVPAHVAAADLDAAWAGLRATRNLVGVGITAPHKIAALALCDELTETARFVGAINIARRDPDGRMVGGNFDGDGFVAGLRATQRDPRGMSVLLLGAGGAAHALAFALAHAGVRRLAIANRTESKAEALAQRVKQAVPAIDALRTAADPSGHDLVINATSRGLAAGDGAPLPVERLTSAMLVADLIMQPETMLLREARLRGCTVHPGRLMLDCQLELRLAFLGLHAPAMGPHRDAR